MAEAAAHPYRWAMLAGLWLLYFGFALAIASTAPLVYLVMADLDLDRGEMGTVLAAWQLVYVLSAVPCGGLLDRAGPRRAMSAGMLVIAASVALRGLAADYWSLLAAAALFGLGGPMISSGAPKVVSQWFAGRERGLALGVYFTGNACGGIVAVALANGLILPAVGDWRGVMFVFAAAIALAALAWLAISAHPAGRAMEDRAGAGPAPRGAFLGLVRDPVVRLVLAMGLLCFFYNHAMIQWLPELLRAYGMTPAEAGYWASVPVLFGMLAALSIPRRATPERRIPILFGLFCCAAAAVPLVWSAWTPLLALGLVVLGACRGAMTSISLLLLMESGGGDSRRMGTAGGLFFSVGEVGGALGPALVGALAHWTQGFDAPLLMMAGVSGLLMLTLAGLRRAQRRED